MTRRVHTFSYFLLPKGKDRTVRTFQSRDDGAAKQILIGFGRLGFQPGEAFLNMPPGDGAAAGAPRRVDLAEAGPGDLLLVTTRPPMHDLHQADRKQVPRGHTDIEERIFEILRRFVDYNARSQILLTDAAIRQLKPGFEDLAGMRFRQKEEGAPFKQLKSKDGQRWKDPRGAAATAMFLLRVDEMSPGGPGLVCAFGMDGTSTLAWAYRLGHDLSHLLEKERFLVARATLGPVPKPAMNLAWAGGWKIEVALDLLLDGKDAGSVDGSTRRKRGGRRTPRPRGRA